MRLIPAERVILLFKRFRQMPIAYQVWILAAFVLIILSGSLSIAYYTITDTLVQSNISYTSDVFSQMKSSLEKQCERLETLLQKTGYNRAVFKYIAADNNSDRYQPYLEMNSLALSANQLEPSVQEFVVKGYNGVEYYSDGKSAEVEQAVSLVPEEVNNYYQLTNLFQYKRMATRRCFLLTTQLRDIYNITQVSDSGQISFVVKIDFLGVDDFTDQFGTELYILDSNHTVCAGNRRKDSEDELRILEQKLADREEAFQTETTIGGTAYLINFDRLPSINGYIMSVTPRATIVSSVYWVRDLTVVLLLTAAALLVLFFFLFSRSLTVPLSQFSRHMERVKTGSVDTMREPVKLDGSREMIEISDRFNSMISEIDRLNHRLFNTMETLYDAEIQKKQTELLYLKSQINPHFLHNTLEVILGVAFTENAPQTVRLIKALSRIFRYSIRGSDTVTVAEELKIVQAYLEIQQTRFYQKFTAEYDFDDTVLQNRIPKMVLQPLIENAITHGLEDRAQGGLLKIGGSFDADGMTLLWVEDNGKGMNEEQLSRLREVIAQEGTFRSESIGFENVVYRIKLLYGKRCRITVESAPDQGTRIELRIPWTE